MKLLKETLRRNRNALLVFAATVLTGAAVFALYDVWLEPLIYAAALGLALLLALLAFDAVREKRRSDERKRALAAIETQWRALPAAASPAEEDWRGMIAALGERMEALTAQAEAERQDMLDYYTAWVHQIKTPIAVMYLKLAEDTPENRALSVELGRIEQYVDMALQFIRVGSGTKDLVIREHSLDALVRETLRRLAPQFVEKRLRLDFAPTGATVVTDEKWFSCILEQLLTNAVKYTPAGAVRIALRDGLLTISDTGIGIAPEDLPRIFEKGYTGLNGRIGQKSSGLGLYLARQAAELLAIPLRAESRVGEGSAFTLDLRRSGLTYKS